MSLVTVHWSLINLRNYSRYQHYQQSQRSHIARHETNRLVIPQAQGSMVGEFVLDILLRHHPAEEDDSTQGTQRGQVYAIEAVYKVEERESRNLDMRERPDRH